ncbi:hypothetical protein NM688_g6721 [Phlebia brevispora]|uniref:Uncharacterized protein n=1 Tax=Phlebia brevispora TaxID=194682 RepID=A0ACC1SD47_9APHY|nr:hypothetical protein NM688_g6721 [Phlebia brevispora]
MRPAVYQTLLNKHGPVEMERQELLYEQYVCQREFIKRLGSIVRVFILPLRRKHTKSWVSGVPVQISRLFDWLEDIVNLHASIADAFDSLSQAWGSGIVIHAASAIRSLVPRLEVYQPYLVRVDEVRHMLTHGVSEDNEFLEFVKMRERHIECGGWTLSDLLYQPVERLADFLIVFQRLLELTPREHPDYLSSFSLSHSTRMIVHVLHEVKTREEEYQFVKDFASRIDNLLPSVQLAKRERRLLWHGEIMCTLQENVSQNISLCEPSSQDFEAGKRSPDSRRIEDEGRFRSRYSPLGPPTPTWNSRNPPPTIVLSPCPDTIDAGIRDARDGGRSPKLKEKMKTLRKNVQCFVFADVLILAEPTSESGSEDPHWSLLPGFGISRVLGVQVGEQITLDLLPLSLSDLHTGVIPESSSSSVIRVSISPSPNGGDVRNEVFHALRRCHAYTLRSLSFPTHNGHYLPHGPHVDLEHDTQQSVMAILNTGLPLPKSPSVQLSDMERLSSVRTGNESDQEREERGWWSLRFQQVLKELQRQDPILALETITGMQT